MRWLEGGTPLWQAEQVNWFRDRDRDREGAGTLTSWTSPFPLKQATEMQVGEGEGEEETVGVGPVPNYSVLGSERVGDEEKVEEARPLSVPTPLELQHTCTPQLLCL